MTPPQPPSAHVVVIGGGLAGLSILKALATSRKAPPLKLTLIDPRPYLEIRWAFIRSLFDSSVADNAVIPYDALFPATQQPDRFTYVQAAAASVASDATSVTLAAPAPGGETQVSCDVVVVATGSLSSYAAVNPGGMSADAAAAGAPTGASTADERRAMLAAEGERLMAARALLVVGGGPIGYELATDFAAATAASPAAAGASVTLVDAGERLLAGSLPPRGSALLLRKAAALGVDVRSGARAEQAGGDGGWAVKGEAVPAGEAVTAVGVRPAAATLLASLPVATSDGWLVVDSFGRVVPPAPASGAAAAPVAAGRLFAAGDVVLSKLKSGNDALGKAAAYARNVGAAAAAVVGGGDVVAAGKAKALPPAPPVMVVTAGPRSGVAKLGPVLDPWMLPSVKNKTWFFAKARGDVKMP